MTATLSTQKPKRLLTWREATWEEYVQLRDYHETSDISRVKLFFYDGAVLVDDMGWEGINHAIIRELIAMLFFAWLRKQPTQSFTSIGPLVSSTAPIVKSSKLRPGRVAEVVAPVDDEPLP